MCVVLKLCLTVLIYLINYFFDYSVCFIQVTNCSIRVSWSFTGNLQPPCLSRVFTPMMILIMIEIEYNNTALLLVVNPCIPHWNNRTAPCLHIKEDASLPAMLNPLCSSTNQQLLKGTFAIKVATMKIINGFCYEWKLSRAHHKINTFHGEQRWMEHKRGHW